MKGLARSYLLWAKMDQEIEEHVKLSSRCQNHSTAPVKAPLHPWACPEKPWIRLHLDFAGPFMERQFLVVVDAFTKWLEVHEGFTIHYGVIHHQKFAAHICNTWDPRDVRKR